MWTRTLVFRFEVLKNTTYSFSAMLTVFLVGLALGSEFHDVGGEAVAVFEPVGHQIVDTRAEHAQAAHADRAGGGAVGVVVGDDEQALVFLNGICQQRGGAADVQQVGGWQ